MIRICILLCISTISLYAQYFTKITTGPQSNDGGDSRSVNWVDYDNDGDLDLFFTNGPKGGANNFLYKNNGNGTFTKVTDASIVTDPGSYDGSTWADYDNDGHIDAFSATWYGQKNSLHRQRNGVFEEVFPQDIAKDGTHSETASWGDYDNDGYVDLYLANSSGTLVNILYHNNGDGTFTKIKNGAPVTDAIASRSVDWCDFDTDGDLDLFVANEGGADESLYWNLGNGTFSAETTSPIVHDAGDSFGSSVADIDNDGDFDILIVNHGNQNESLFLNNGNATFTKMIADPVVTSGGYSVGSAFGDLDNDGDLDLVVTNAFSGTSKAVNFLFMNKGNGTFTKMDTGIVSTDQGWSYGVAFGDYDRDGDLDIATGNCFGANQHNALYRNEGNSNGWLTVKAVGTVSNFSAIGARVNVKATINGKPVWQYRHVAGQSGYCGQNLEAHFGLGDATIIDSLVVIFPSGQKIIQTQVIPKKLLTITEPRPAGYFRGALQIGTFNDMAPVTIFFKDITNADPSQPANSWKWDLNGDGTIDAVTETASFHYTQADTYSVTLIVSNGAQTDTVKSTDAIIVTPSTAIISFSTATHNFGGINVNIPQKDTTLFVYNKGKLADSIFVSLIYGSSSAGTIKPDSALSITPTSFVLAPDDSQAITFSIFPPKVIRTNLNITYTPKIVVTSKFNAGEKIFEKPMWIKLLGTLMSNEVKPMLPVESRLSQNYPNPFNPTTTIQFSIATAKHSVTSTTENKVTLEVFNVLGKKVSTLLDEMKAAGEYSLQWNASGFSSGIYFYRLRTKDFTETRKLLLMK
ncbi:MAG: FG-GAP-like repeat-containing protein [Bacteriovoracaceae bacterium]|nr:FG-GAP-like repeat-containing protein [Bacteroidota bacterium]